MESEFKALFSQHKPKRQLCSLKSKRALVTGCSSGIGLSVTLGLLSEGCHVWGVARRENRLRALSEYAISFPLEGQFQYIPGDLAAPATLSNLELRCSAGLDILVCNAGLALGTDPISEGSVSQWEQMISTNLTTTLKTLKTFLPKMIQQGSGHIVILGSVAGHHSYAGGAVYCATKHAVTAIARALRQETCDKNIRVSLVSPGMVETEFSQVRYEGDLEKAKQVYKGLKPLSAMDIAEQVLFVLQQPQHVNVDDLLVMPTQQAHPLKVHRQAD